MGPYIPPPHMTTQTRQRLAKTVEELHFYHLGPEYGSKIWISNVAVPVNWGSFWGVLMMRAILFRVYIRAPDSWLLH